MSGFKVPVFFGAILTLVVLVLQNRASVFQLTLLGFRSRPFSLGVLVAIAVLSGQGLGIILQRIGTRRRPKTQHQVNQPRENYAGPAEYQSLYSGPVSEDSDADSEDESAQPNSNTRGWDSEVAKSWTEQAERVEEEGRFWSRPQKKDKKRGSVTPIQSKRRKGLESSEDKSSVVDAEYRLVPPPEQQSDESGFDDQFFDDFFEEDEP